MGVRTCGLLLQILHSATPKLKLKKSLSKKGVQETLSIDKCFTSSEKGCIKC